MRSSCGKWRLRHSLANRSGGGGAVAVNGAWERAALSQSRVAGVARSWRQVAWRPGCAAAATKAGGGSERRLRLIEEAAPP